MTKKEIIQSQAWCILRTLVYTAYREARHLGPEGDANAKVTVSDGTLSFAAKRCRSERARLKSRELHKLTASAHSVADVLSPYKESTHLSVDDLIQVFSLPNWISPYGGLKWAKIAETLKDLICALQADDVARAKAIAGEVILLKHNSGPLVPTRAAWERDRWLREKWPQLCE